MTVEARGLADVVRRLEAMQARARDLSPVLAVAASDTVAVIDDAFETSTSPAGDLWAPLKPSTVARRRNGSSKPLIDSSRLRNSANARAEGTTLRFGTNVGYGIFHMDSRRFLPVDGEAGAYVLGETGPAAAHWARVRAMVKRYILTGELG